MQLNFLTELGYNVFSTGGYSKPDEPGDQKRPSAPNVPYFPELHAACQASHTAGVHPQECIPDAVLDWADTIIYHHYLDRLYNQWDTRIQAWLDADSAHQVIWRTVGQSVQNNEEQAAPFRAKGMRIMRYSPREWGIPGFVGHDALIRFWVDPDEWTGWTGTDKRVCNITQHLMQRDPWTNWRAFKKFVVDQEIPYRCLGPGSEEIGGPGMLPFEDMKQALREARCYLYTGTQPASYTLGLIEAMMTGVPVVCIHRNWMTNFPYGSRLFEGPDLCVLGEKRQDAESVPNHLRALLNDADYAADISRQTRNVALEHFAKNKIADQWKEFLG